MVCIVNCEKITYYIEKGFLTELKISEKMQVKIHAVLCKKCRHYAPDSEALNEILRMLSDYENGAGLSDTEKQDLKEALKNIG